MELKSFFANNICFAVADHADAASTHSEKITNGLNIPVDVEVVINNTERRGAGAGNKKSITANGGTLPLGGYMHRPDLDELKFIYQFSKMPKITRNGKDIYGVKIKPGKSEGIAHHITCIQKGTAYEVHIHYMAEKSQNASNTQNASNKLKIVRHVDPDIEHPDG